MHSRSVERESNGTDLTQLAYCLFGFLQRTRRETAIQAKIQKSHELGARQLRSPSSISSMLTASWQAHGSGPSELSSASLLRFHQYL